MNMLFRENIPAELQALPQWVVWKIVMRNGDATKLPYQIDGSPAKSNDPSTWSTFDKAVAASPEYSGIGFVFSESDPYCGVDLDGCRDPETGKVAEWAKGIILSVASYAEVSPSRTGVKIWVRANWPLGGKKIAIEGEQSTTTKQAAIEIYSKGRYFAMTGKRLENQTTIQDRQSEVDALRQRFWPENGVQKVYVANADFKSSANVFDRARKYIAKMPPSVSGQGGHNAAFHAACTLVLGFELSPDEALALLAEWNTTCRPPWNNRELRHKVESAAKQPGERGYLRNVEPKHFDKVPTPHYVWEDKPEPPKSTTLEAAAASYLEYLESRGENLVETGLPDLDYAIGGGVEFGELMLCAARPSHGKSVLLVQMVQHWTSQGMPCAIISEEMSSRALGKRVVQNASGIPREHWPDRIAAVKADLAGHFKGRAVCSVIEKCRTIDAVAEALRREKEEHGIKCAAVDYAQLLTGSGRDRYERTTNVSIGLRHIASDLQILVVAAAQLSRGIEDRPKFLPQMSDLKETGQLEQDADVIIAGVWPHRLDETKDPHEYRFFVLKNRNRPINQNVVKCRFNPPRQMFTDDPRPDAMGWPDFNEPATHSDF
jgi:hypothetical protein